MSTYEEKIREWASDMKDNDFKVMLSDDGNVCRELIVLNKLEIEKVLYIKGDNKPLSIGPRFVDSPKGKFMFINVTSLDDIDKPEKGILAWIDLSKELFVNALKNVVKGTVELHFYTISNDLTEISAKTIFNTEISKVALERELEFAGV
ncbi:MAG TPA: hypothetical protein VIM51_05340 [Desulfosporosinus sp.]